MDFKDYNASQIVPQQTLLRKFNKICEYLKEYVPPQNLIPRYKHTITLKNPANQELYPMIVYSFSKDKAYTIEDLTGPNFIKTGILISKSHEITESIDYWYEYQLEYSEYYDQYIVSVFKTTFDTESAKIGAVSSDAGVTILRDIVEEL